MIHIKNTKETNLKRYKRKITFFDNNKDPSGSLHPKKIKTQLNTLDEKDRRVIAEALGIKGDDTELARKIEERLTKLIKENSESSQVLINKAINAYEKLVRDEAYGQIFARQKRINSILSTLFKVGLLSAFTGIMLSMVILPAAQQAAERKEKLKKLKNLDLSELKKNKEMIENLKAGNLKALGSAGEGIHPFAQKVDAQKLFGRNLQEGEMEALSALSFRKDILQQQESELKEKPGNMPPEDIKAKLAEVMMNKKLVDQQISLQELDTRYSPEIQDDANPQTVVDQHKQLVTKLEDKIPNLEMFLEKKKIEMATAEQTEGVDKEKLEALSGTIGNLGVETEYLKKRLIAEQEIVTTDIQSEERIPDWQERLDQKEQEVMSAMREQIIEEGTITRDQQEPYESSKIRTTQMLLKLKELITAQETQPSEQRSEQPEEPVEINETENSPQASEKNTNSHVLANIATQGREI